MPTPDRTGNYMSNTVDDLRQMLPDCDDTLLPHYAQLVHTTGIDTTPEDVHHAWAAWRITTEPDHADLLPWDHIGQAVRVLDVPYAVAVRAVAAQYLTTI